MRLGILVGISLSLSACVSLNEKGAQVRVTSNSEVVSGCKFIANVDATSGWAGGATGLAESNTQKTLQNKTAELGGNVLYMTSNSIHSSGEAYSCPPR